MAKFAGLFADFNEAFAKDVAKSHGAAFQRVLKSHAKEAERKKTAFTNYGWVISADGICSKTDRKSPYFILETSMRTGAVVHQWHKR